MDAGSLREEAPTFGDKIKWTTELWLQFQVTEHSDRVGKHITRPIPGSSISLRVGYSESIFRDFLPSLHMNIGTATTVTTRSILPQIFPIYY